MMIRISLKTDDAEVEDSFVIVDECLPEWVVASEGKPQGQRRQWTR